MAHRGSRRRRPEAGREQMRPPKGSHSGGNHGMTTSSEVLVAARGAGRRYARRVALAPIELEVRAGECVALLGPNGAGKTTLLTLLAGAAQPSDGRIERTSERTGWVPQRPALYRKLSARENLRLFAELERLASPQAEAERLLELGRSRRRGGPPRPGALGRQRPAPERGDRPGRRPRGRVPGRADGEPRSAPARAPVGAPPRP